jgi:hypothetical protein
MTTPLVTTAVEVASHPTNIAFATRMKGVLIAVGRAGKSFQVGTSGSDAVPLFTSAAPNWTEGAMSRLPSRFRQKEAIGSPRSSAGRGEGWRRPREPPDPWPSRLGDDQGRYDAAEMARPR